MNRISEVITPEGKLLNRFTYEADGQLAGTMDELGGGIRLTYDLAGRRIHALTTGGSSQSYRYDAMGNIIGLTDGMSNTTGFMLDSWGRITGVKKPDGTMEKYAYDYMGNILRAEDGEGEEVMDAIMKKNGYECLPTKLKSNNGIDGIYVKKGPDGKITEVVIGEAKFGSSRLNLDPEIGPQMSNKWIEGNLNRMIAEGTPKVSKTASDIFEFLDNGGKYTASIFRTRNTGYISVKYRNMLSTAYLLWK